MSSKNLPAVVPGQTLNLTLADTLSLGETLAKSGFFSDARSAAQAVVKLLAGRELGFPSIASMVGVHIIEGKPAIGAHLLAASIKRSGRYDYRVLRCDREACELEFLEKGQAVGKIGMTFQEAADSGLALGKDGKVKSNWHRTPDDMLFARCISKGFRRYCPDLTTGMLVYTPDELEGDESSPPPPPPPEPPQQEAPRPPSPAAPPPSTPSRSATEAVEAARITEEQAAELGNLIRDTGTDPAKVLAHYQIKGLMFLPASRFVEVRDYLRGKLATLRQTPLTPPPQPDSVLELKARRGEVDQLCEQLGYHQEPQRADFVALVRKVYGTPDLLRLDLAKLTDLRDRLLKKLNDKRAAKKVGA